MYKKPKIQKGETKSVNSFAKSAKCSGNSTHISMI